RPSSRLTPRRPSTPTPFPYTTLFRSQEHRADRAAQRLRDLLPLRATVVRDGERKEVDATELVPGDLVLLTAGDRISADLVLEHVDRKSTRLNSSHVKTSYAVFCLKTK